jgi:hypothetical protein
MSRVGFRNAIHEAMNRNDWYTSESTNGQTFLQEQL